MKYVNFTRVSIKNFLSVGEEPVVIDFNQGLNIITGNNKDKVDRRNGVGKSTVADSIYFAIFGTTLRELKKDHIVNNITQRNCEVELELYVNEDGNTSKYKIIRKISPTKCFLYKDGEDITRDSIQNTTEYICSLLNTSADVFQNCVIMTINNATPFMAKKKLEKRKFIEGIFNLQVFSNMLNVTRQEYNKVVRDLDIECAKYEEISNSLNNYIEQKQNNENEKQRSLAKLHARKSNNNKQIESYNDQLSKHVQIDIEKTNQNIKRIDSVSDELHAKTQRILTKKTECQTLIDVHTKKRNKIGTDQDVCPVCLSKLDESHINYVEDEKSKLTNTISELKNKYTELEAKLKDAKQILKTLSDKKNKQLNQFNEFNLQKQNICNIESNIKQLTSVNKDIDDDIKSLDKQDNNLDKIIKDTNLRLERVQIDIDRVKNEISKLDIIKFVVSEEGVKSYIVKKILQLFNAKLAHYLKKMDSNCICVFNEYFEEEIINEKGKPCSYFNFSGAERKNIDLACLFAFMDIRRLQGDVAFNFSMYDELFDSSLDERGVELVIEILKERIEQHNECVMVISHRKESTKLATGEIIFLEKQNGVTLRVETPKNELK